MGMEDGEIDWKWKREGLPWHNPPLVQKEKRAERGRKKRREESIKMNQNLH